MAFIGSWFGLGNAIPNFDYTFDSRTGGEEAGTNTRVTAETVKGVTWTLRPGTCNQAKVPVTIFELNTAKVAAENGVDATELTEFCNNVMKKAKTLRLPGILKCFGTAEHKDTYYIATEPCLPLSLVLDSKKEEYYGANKSMLHNAIALALNAMGAGLSALHKNGLVHNNVSTRSIFVTESGDWRLFGLELVSQADDTHSVYERFYKSVIPEYCFPPEVCNSAGKNAPVDLAGRRDAWGIAVTLCQVFSGEEISPSDFDVTTTDMPAPLRKTYAGLANSSPRMRYNVERMLQSDFLVKSDYVKQMQELDELAIKDAAERENYYRQLTLVAETYPPRVCKYIVIPKLTAALSFGGGSAGILEPLLKVGSRLESADFSSAVSPAVTALFQSDEHMTRYKLLTSANNYAAHLPSDLVCNKIWPHFITGFGHRNSDIRELTIRALVSFAPHLNESIMTGDVQRYIGQLQQDREGPIRANATICFGLIAQHLPASSRNKILLTAFIKMLKDPYLPSRSAAVKSLGSTLEYYDEKEMSQHIIPALSTVLLDVNVEIRKNAMQCVRWMLDKVDKISESMPSSALGDIDGPMQEPKEKAVNQEKSVSQAEKNELDSSASAGKSSTSRNWFSGWGSSAGTTQVEAKKAEENADSAPGAPKAQSNDGWGEDDDIENGAPGLSSQKMLPVAVEASSTSIKPRPSGLGLGSKPVGPGLKINTTKKKIGSSKAD